MLDLPSKWRGDTARLSCFIICQGLHVDKALIWMFGVSSSIRLNQIQAICLHVLSIWFYVLVCRQTWLSKKKNELHPVEKTEEKNNFEIFSFFCVVSSWASFLIAPQVKQLNSLNFIFFRFILCSDWIYTAYISLLKSTYFLSPRLFLEEWDCWSHSFSLWLHFSVSTITSTPEVTICIVINPVFNTR